MSESNTRSALLAAVLTGVFTVAASLITYYVTTKEPKLTYSVVGSPALSSADGVKRIFVAEVVNTGRKEIGGVLARVAMPSGELGEIAYETSPGVKITRSEEGHTVDLKADMLNQGDFVKVSFLTTSKSVSGIPQVVVRAPGVKGTLKSNTTSETGWEGLTRWLSLVAGALAAVGTTFALFTGSWLARKVGVPNVGSSLDQAEVSAFVCGACSLPVEAERLRFGSHISFRGTADYLYLRSRSESPEKKLKYAAALRCMLLTRDISSNSLSTIRQNISLIEGSELSEREYTSLRSRSVSEGVEPLVWRTLVLEYAESELARLYG